jgi:O-antigen ligase
MTLLQVIIVFTAFAAMQLLIGGGRMLYSIPAYSVLAIAALVGLPRLWKTRPSASFVCVASTLLLAAYLLVRALHSPVPYLARPDLYLIFGALLAYLLFTYEITDPSIRLWFALGLIALALGHVGVGIIQFRDGNNFYPWPWIFRADYGSRASGFYICPNHLAGLLEVLIAFGISFTCWSRVNRAAKILVGYCTGVLLLGIAFTGSRGGYISTFVAILVVAALSLTLVIRNRPHAAGKVVLFALLGLGLLALCGVLLFFNSDLVNSRVSMIYEPQNMRLLLWAAALKQFALNPIWGTGSGTYLYYGREFRHPSVQNDPIYVHNDYLHLLAEYGLVGAVLFSTFLVLHCWKGWSSFNVLRERASRSEALASNALALNIGALAAIAAMAVHSVVDFNMHIPANALLIGFVFAIFASPAFGKRTAPAAATSVLRLAIPCAAIAILLVALPFVRSEYLAEQSRMALRDAEAVPSAAMNPYIERAIAFAQDAAAADPNNPNPWYYLGDGKRVLAMRQERASEFLRLNNEAIDALQRGLTIFPQDTAIRLKLARALDAAVRYREAETILKGTIAINPNLGNVYTMYGLHLQERGLLTVAAEQFKHALSLRAEDQIASAALAEIAAAKQQGVPDSDAAADE